VVLVGALSLIAAGWLGMGVGRLIPSTYTPPVLAVLGFVLLLVPTELMKYESVTKLVHLAPGSFNVGEEFDAVVGTVDVAQAAWFGGLALAGAVLFMVSRRAAIAAVVPVVVGLIIAVPVLNAGPASGVQIDAGAVAEVCTTDSGPEVCVLKAHESALSTLVGPAREALTLMAKLPNAPTSVHEVTPDRAQPQPASQVWLSSENYFAGHGWEDGLLQRVLAGAGTLPCPDSDGRTRMLVGNALAGTEPKNLTGPGQEEWKAETTALWQALKALPADERDRRIAAVRAAGLTCGDVTAALGVGGGA
jgi:hypothetical protein